jgi:FKBP-type peptidyl-prolyl cis-trans isomerase FklB
MRQGIITVPALLAIATMVTACHAPGAKQGTPPPAVTTDKQKTSYAIGVKTAQNLAEKLGLRGTGEFVARGFKDAFTGAKQLMTPTEIQDTIGAYQAQEAKKHVDLTDTTSVKSSDPNSPLKTLGDHISYLCGANLASHIRAVQIDIDVDWLDQGITDQFSGKKLALTDAEIKSLVEGVDAEIRKKQQAAIQEQMTKMKAQGDKNEKEGAAFLAKNKKAPGVKTLADGLQYKVLKAGTGKKPKSTNSVVCNYRGTLIDGTEFDSSAKHGGPATFPVTGVIKGWTEALQLMPLGSKWRLFIPSSLAYGPTGAGGVIGPNATLIFDIELLKIK